jgi:uncharacterized membrane protein YedE/YeeE
MRRLAWLLVYALVGVAFGLVLTKAEIVSWFRIQEMFRFQGFHMFGVFALAIPVAVASVQALKRGGARSLEGGPIALPPKAMGSGVRYFAGGIVFGVGWALTGACPGPLFALLGAGAGGGAILVAIAAALLGTFVYGLVQPRLPH